MKVIRASSEAAMIAEFLRREYASAARYGADIARCLAIHDAQPSLLTEPDLINPGDNDIRHRILGCFRGYGEVRPSFFTDFPTDGVIWQWVQLDREEFLATQFIRYWAALWGGCRDPRQVARMIRDGEVPEQARTDGTLERIEAVAESLRMDRSIPPLLMVSADHGQTRVVMEGNTRLTAYGLAEDELPAKMTVLLGTSPDIAHWDEY